MSITKRLVTETGKPSKQRTVLKFEEYDKLLTFMEEHPELAKGVNRGLKASLSLNLLADSMKMKGFDKDAKQWAKHWSEWKYRVRRRALQIKAAKEQNSSLNIKPFTPLEERLLKLIGDQAIKEIIIRTDPLGELVDEEPGPNIFEDDNTSANQDGGSAATRTRRRLKRRHCSRDSDLEDCISLPGVKPSTRDNGGEGSAATRTRRRLKRRHSSRDSDLEDCISLPEVKPSTSNNGGEGTDGKDETATFLDLERQKLETTKQLLKAVESVAFEAREIVNVLTQIKDIFLSRNSNI